MALPGVNTILRDRFYTLSRTDIPTGPRVLAIARRSNTAGAAISGSTRKTAPDYDPFSAVSELDVIKHFGENSELHRAYQELVAGGAARVTLVAIPAGTSDSDLASVATNNAFDTAFDAAETAQPDIIVPWGRGGDPLDWNNNTATPTSSPAIGFVADNSSTLTVTNGMNFAKRVSDKCKDITDRSHPVFAVLGVKPFTSASERENGSMTPAEVATHLELSGLPSRSDAAFTNGHYASVVAGELATTGYKSEWGYSNGAALYAGLLASLEPWNSATGKTAFNVNRMRYVPTRTQQDSLITKGVVPVGQNYSRVAVWVDALTFSTPGSDYARLSTLRIVFDAMNVVRQAASQFIGQPATLHHRNALDTAITSTLHGMIQQGALLDADHVVSYVPSENKAVIDLVLRPAFEIRNIDVSISVQL